MTGITYDAGALIAAERDDRLVWLLHRRALDRGMRPTVPAGVLGQAWRGGPQARLSRLLKGCHIEPLDERRARIAGHTCGRAGTSDIVDAVVAAGAVARKDLVVTSDTDDIEHLATALGASLEIVAV